MATREDSSKIKVSAAAGAIDDFGEDDYDDDPFAPTVSTTNNNCKSDANFTISLDDDPPKAKPAPTSGHKSAASKRAQSVAESEDFTVSLGPDNITGNMADSTYLDARASACESVDLSAASHSALGSGAAPAARPTRANSGKSSNMVINITDPVKTGDGMQAHTSYKVTTKTTNPEYPSSEFSVVRRYRDFLWLQQSLSDANAGYIIPPLPDKAVVGRFAPEFVEARRRALEKFANRVASHPILHTDEIFKIFVEASDDVLESTKLSLKEKKAKAETAMSKGKQMFKEFTFSLSTKFKDSSSQANMPQDAELAGEHTNCDASNNALTNVLKNAQLANARLKGSASGLSEFSLACNMIGTTEKDYVSHAFTQLALTTDRLSLLAKEQADEDEIEFVDQVMDYHRMGLAAKQTLDNRSHNLLTYQTACSEAHAKKHALEKARNNAKAKNVDELEKGEKDAEERVEVMKDRYERIVETTKSEFERLEELKSADFKETITKYIELQIKYSKRTTELWESLLPEIQAKYTS